MVSDAPTKNKPMPAPKAEPVKTVQKMTPVASKPAPMKAEPTPVKEVESKPVATFKPKTESTAKKGIDAALDGLE